MCSICVLWNFFISLAEFLRLADLPSLVDLVFVGNPLEEKHAADGNWIEEATKRLPKLKKLDGEYYISVNFQFI